MWSFAGCQSRDISGEVHPQTLAQRWSEKSCDELLVFS